MGFGRGPKIVTDGLVLALDAANTKSYPGSGTALNDLGPNRNSHTLLNGTGFTSEYGGGLTFDGTDDRVGTTDSSNLTPSTVSFFAVAKQTSTAQSTAFIGGYGNTGYDGYWLGASGADLKFSVGNNNTHNGGAGQFTIASEDTNVHYLGGTFDGTTIKTYIDGNSPISYTHSNPGTLAYDSISQGFKLGNIEGNTGTRHWTGNIYYVQVYNRVLSDAEVLQNFNAIRSRFGL